MFLWHQVFEHFGVPALLVALVLVAMGLASVVVFAERMLTIGRSRAAARRFAAGAEGILDRHSLPRWLEESRQHHAGHLARLAEAGLAAFVDAEARDAAEPSPVELTRRHLEREVESLVADLRRGLPVLATVGSVAPFVGLLGTVLGIITAFQAIAATGSGGLSSVSAGIAEALIETALGLGVAIPAVFMFNYLSSQIAREELKLRHAAGELVDGLESLPPVSRGGVQDNLA